MDTELNNTNVSMTTIEKIKFLGHFITKIFLYVVIVLFAIMYALFCLYFGNLLHNINEKDNRPTLFNAYVIVSGSMIPNIKIEDGVVIKREKPNKLKQGDIITFQTHDQRYNGLVITHRIIGIEKTDYNKFYFRTKGDANSSEDSYLVKEEDIYGRVFLMIPKVGHIRNVLSNNIYWLLIIIIPAAVIIIYDVYKLLVHINDNDKKEEVEEELEII
ncbi:MAG: signal peptidase I [Bacilli bacterium]|nr:signal peptidase I [Bacilli bacterium]